MSTSEPSRRPRAFGDLAAMPATMTVPEAGRRGWGLSRAKSYELAAAGQFPCAVQTLGARYVVRAADLLRALGVDPEALLIGTRADPAAPVNERTETVNERAARGEGVPA